MYWRFTQLKSFRIALLSLTLFSTLALSPGYAATPTLDEQFATLRGKSIMTELRANDKITRAEFAAVVTRLMELPVVVKKLNYVDTLHHWAENSGIISFVVSKQLMVGTSKTSFSPNVPITYQEASIVFSRAGYEKLGSISSMPKTQNELTRDDMVRYAYDIFTANRQAITEKLGVTSVTVSDATTVRVSFSDGKSQTYTVDPLQQTVETYKTFTYQGQEFRIQVKYEGSPIKTVEPYKTRVSVNAGIISKDALPYKIKNADGQIVPLRDNMKVEFSSSIPNVSKDGFFDNTINKLPAGSTFTYTVTLKTNANVVVDSKTITATVYAVPVGFITQNYRMIQSVSGAGWSTNFVTTANNGIDDARLRLIINKSKDANGNIIDVNTGANDIIEENVGPRSFYSTDERVVKVDPDGTLTAYAPGYIPIVVINGDNEYRNTLTVYTENVPTTVVFQELYKTQADTSVTFKILDQFGLNTRSMKNGITFQTGSNTSAVINTKNATLSYASGSFLLSNLTLRPGVDQLKIYRNGAFIGQIQVNVRS